MEKEMAKQKGLSPVAMTVALLGYPVLSIVLVAALGAERFMGMYLNVAIGMGLCTVMGGWKWWHSRGQAPEASEMPTGVFVSTLGYWFVLPLMWALDGPGPFATGLRMAALCSSLLAVVSAIFLNGFFVGQYEARRKIREDHEASPSGS
jgi:Ca2+/H+ antiporter